MTDLVRLGPCVVCGAAVFVEPIVTGDWRMQTLHLAPDQSNERWRVVIGQGGSSYPACYSAPHAWRGDR